MEKDHHLADPGIHLGYRIRYHGHHALGESGTIRQPVRSFIIRWFVIRLHLYGDRLRNLADELERNACLRRGILNLCNPSLYAGPVFHLLSGGLMLGAIFMATDYVTSPMSNKGMIIYGIGIGLLTVVIRVFGAYPEGMSFAILIMNAFTPLINSYIKPKHFGGK